jgi:cytochrome P450
MTAAQPTVEFDPFELQDTLQGDIRDPHSRLEEARRRFGPVMAGTPFEDFEKRAARRFEKIYTVLGHAEAETVLREADTFTSTVYKDVIGMVMGRCMIAMDGAEHLANRALVSPAFRRKLLARWESELVQVVVDELIDRFAGRGRAELVRELTFPFPVQVIARLLGLPRQDYPRFQRWSIELLSVMFNWDRAITASGHLRQYFAGILEERRRQPADDIISDLAVAEIDGQRLTDEEVFGFLRLMLPAGVETTYRSSGNLLVGLLTHPDQLAEVASRPALVADAIEEALRWEPPIVSIARMCTRPVRLGGVDLPEGAFVNVCVAAANRDPARYPDPARFDIHRGAQRHLTFGFGAHLCLGMHLARMETRVAVSRLLDRLPGLRLDPAREAPYVQGLAFRSPAAIHVVFD